MPYEVLNEAEAKAAPETNIGMPRTSVGATLASLRAALDFLLGERDDLTLDDLNGWINEAYLDLVTSLNLDEFKGSIGITLDPEQNLYLLPDRLDSLLSVSLVLPQSQNMAEGYPLGKIDLMAYRTLIPKVDEPRYYFRHGQSLLVLYPKPGKTRTIAVDGRFSPEKLTLATDSPLLNPVWHEAIKIGARARGFRALREYEKAAEEDNAYVAFIRRRKDPAAAEDENRVVKSSTPQRSIYNRTRRRL